MQCSGRDACDSLQLLSGLVWMVMHAELLVKVLLIMSGALEKLFSAPGAQASAPGARASAAGARGAAAGTAPASATSLRLGANLSLMMKPLQA